jgi:hypothetical protein
MAVNLGSIEIKCEAIKCFTLIREAEYPTLSSGLHIIGLVITSGLSVCGLSVGTHNGEGSCFKIKAEM